MSSRYTCFHCETVVEAGAIHNCVSPDARPLYADLGLEPDATPEAISAAYRKRAKAAHPDTGGDPAAFDRVARAALVLRDPVKRARYDKTGQVDDQPDNAAPIIAGLQVGAFNAAMSKGNYEVTNIIRVATGLLRDQLAEMKKGLASLATEKTAVGSARRRLKFKGKGRNVIGDMLNQKDAQLDAAIAQGGIEMANVETAIAGMKDFDWEVDAAPVFDPMEKFATGGMFDNEGAFDALRRGPHGRR